MNRASTLPARRVDDLCARILTLLRANSSTTARLLQRVRRAAAWSTTTREAISDALVRLANSDLVTVGACDVRIARAQLRRLAAGHPSTPARRPAIYRVTAVGRALVDRPGRSAARIRRR